MKRNKVFLLFFVLLLAFVFLFFIILEENKKELPEKGYTDLRKEAIEKLLKEKTKKIIEEKSNIESYLKKDLKSAKDDLLGLVKAIEDFDFIDEINEKSSKELKEFLEKSKIEISNLGEKDLIEYSSLEEELQKASEEIGKFYGFLSQKEIGFGLYYLGDVERKNALKEKSNLEKESGVNFKEFNFDVGDGWFYKGRKFIFLPE